MTLLRRRAPLSLALAGAALIALLLVIPLVVHAQSAATAPSNLTAQLLDGGALLAWDAPDEDAASVTGYEILYRRTDLHAPGDFQTLVADTESTATTYTDATANVAGKRYTYRVKAVRGSATSNWSNYAYVDVPEEPTPTPTPTATPTPTPTPTPTATPTPEPEPETPTGPLTGFTLVDASDQTVLATLTDGIAVELDDPAGGDYAIRVDVESGSAVGSVYLALTGAKSHSQTESVAPYSLYGDGGANALTGESLPVGGYQLEATAYSQGQGNGDELGTLSVSFTVTETASTPTPTPAPTPTPTPEPEEPSAGPLTGFTLVDDSGQTVLATLTDGDAVELDDPAGGDYAIRADVESGSSIGSVYLQLTGAKSHSQTESVAPYSLYGDGGANALTGGTLPVGSYDLQATAYSAGNKGGDELGTLSVSFTVTETATTPAVEADPMAPGDLTYEIVDDGIVLNWTAPVADAGSVTGYQVLRRKPDSQPRLTVWEEDTGSTETTYKDGAARFPGEVYLYRVIALRGNQESPRSNKVVVERPVETAERAPSNLAYAFLQAADFSVSAVTLGWDAPVQDAGPVTGYRVQRAVGDGEFATLVDDTASLTTGYTDSTVAEGQTYRYRVIALRGRLQSLPSPAQAVELTAPRAVGGTVETADPPPLIALPVRDSGKEFDTLSAAGNNRPTGLWSNGATMWVAHRPNVAFGDTSTAKIYAYKMADMSRDSGKDFDTLDAAGNTLPLGIWSDRTTMWVADSDRKIYAYRMSDKSRDAAKDFGSVAPFVGYIWSNGEVLWLSTYSDERKLFAYDLATRSRFRDQDFPDLFDFGATGIKGIWSDGDTMWVADSDKDKVFAYRMSSRIPVREGKFDLVSGNGDAGGIWSDGDTMWVVNTIGSKIYAYELPEVPDEPEVSTLVSVDQITAASAVITTNLKDMPYDFVHQTEPLSVNYGLTGQTWHITEGHDSVSMPMRGLQPNTEYTMEVQFNYFPVGSVTFTTGNSGLASLAVSDVSPSGAQVTVSLLPGSSAQNVRLRYKETSLSLFPGNWTVLSPQEASTRDEFGFAASGTTTFTLSGLAEGDTYDVDAYTDTRFPNTFPSSRPLLPADSWVASEDAFTTAVTPKPESLLAATMSVGVNGSRKGFQLGSGSLSARTFSLLGLGHTVQGLFDELDGSQHQLKLVLSNQPVSDFILEVEGVGEFHSGAAAREFGTSTYTWDISDPNWASGDTVDVEIKLALIGICDRSTGMQRLLLEITPSYDYCDGVSQLELDGITALDLTARGIPVLESNDFQNLFSLTRLDLSGAGLRELPEGIFDNLTGVTHLDLSHNYLSGRLTDYLFDHMESLRYLSLADNRLSPRLPDTLFGRQGALEELDLRGYSRDADFNPSCRQDTSYAWNPRTGSPLAFETLTSLKTSNWDEDAPYGTDNYSRPPGKPRNLRVSESNGSFTLDWDVPLGQSGITGYRIERNHHGDGDAMGCRTPGKTSVAYVANYDHAGEEIGTTGAGEHDLHGRSGRRPAPARPL